VLLDVDDTLIDTRAAIVAAGEAAVAELWPQAGPEVHHAAAVRFHADPGGLFLRFAAGELSFREMREARIGDLELDGLAGAFDAVTTRDTLGFGKPDARAFHHACGLLGTAPAETLYVGDHLEVDAIAATGPCWPAPPSDRPYFGR